MAYNIVVEKEDLQIISIALAELPFKVSAPLIDKLNKQIAEQHASKPEKVKEEK